MTLFYFEIAKGIKGVRIHFQSILYDAVYIPGGRQSVDALMAQGDALHFVNEAFKHAKIVGASNEGVDLLAPSQIAGTPLAGADTKGSYSMRWGRSRFEIPPTWPRLVPHSRPPSRSTATGSESCC
ncbi:MAG TPA: hypothetical protein VEZ72_03565 [Paenibacillus sp.]|nr:hypothetical protein [Paenibacillus sp.]